MNGFKIWLGSVMAVCLFVIAVESVMIKQRLDYINDDIQKFFPIISETRNIEAFLPYMSGDLSAIRLGRTNRVASISD